VEGDRRREGGMATRRIVIASAALLMAACDNGHGTAATPTVTTPPTSAPVVTSPAPPTPSMTPSPTAGPPRRATPPASGRCGTGALTGRVVPSGPAAGHRYAALVLTNRSGAPCRIYGYAGMRLIGSGGAALPTRVVRETSPAAATVTLPAGASAWAMLRWSLVPADGEPTHGACAPTPSNLWVTPPDQTTHLTVPWTEGMVCASGTIFTTAFAPGTGP
jgi:hypothetical protein